MNDNIERWLPVRGYEGLYDVSDLGRVRSLDRIVMSRNRWGPIAKHLRGQTLAQRTDYYGYQVVRLYRDGYGKWIRVHRLVGEAFLGPRQPGMDTRHGPGGQQANGVAEICYGTRAENEQDKIRDGTFRHGRGSAVPRTRRASSRDGNAKLTQAIAEEIRERYRTGARQADLAALFGVTQPCISQIVLGKTWVS
jgi:predicted XRE-type DNA-binding protein